jgi:hypothetical protein
MPEMLGGNLAQVPLVDVLKLLTSSGQTGLLRVADAATTGEIFVQEGNLVHAVSEGQMGERAVYALMAWQRGSFSFAPGVTAPESSITMPTDRLLDEGSRHAREWREIKRVIPSGDVVFRLSASGSSGAVSLEPEEWQVLAKVDGERDVWEIAETLALDELLVSQVLVGLATKGLLELTAGRQVGPTPLVNGEFFTQLEEQFVSVVGPLGPVIIDDEIAAMGETRGRFPRARAAELVERISVDVEDEGKRARFQQAILELLRSLQA